MQEFTSQIGIDLALKKLNDTYDVDTLKVKYYGLRFITEKDGLIVSREMIVQKRTKGYRQNIQGTDPRGRAAHSLQAHGLLPVVDVETSMPKDITLAMIYGFRDSESNTWQKVFH